jgi:hypothetical protein
MWLTRKNVLQYRQLLLVCLSYGLVTQDFIAIQQADRVKQLFVRNFSTRLSTLKGVFKRTHKLTEKMLKYVIFEEEKNYSLLPLAVVSARPGPGTHSDYRTVSPY